MNEIPWNPPRIRRARPASRTHWAAIGAAVAVTLGAGGVGLIHATSPAGAAAFVPITPCRLFDTRPEFQVGPRATPLVADETYSLTATGAVGECSVPVGATGLVLNVTAVGASEPTFLTFWPGGQARPTASSLNPTPGEPPTPNAVTTALDQLGQLSVYNRRGVVHLLADVVGYYTDHTHDDRYYSRAEVDALVAGASGGGGDTYTKAQVDARIAAAVSGERGYKSWGAGSPQYYATAGTHDVISTAPYTAPVDWLCEVTSSATFVGDNNGSPMVISFVNAIRRNGAAPQPGVNESSHLTEIAVPQQLNAIAVPATRTTVFAIPAGTTFEFGIRVTTSARVQVNLLVAYDCEPGRG